VGLPERLRWVAYGYASGTPARVLGDELGVSVGRVSQLHAQALGLLRGELDAWLAGRVDPPRACVRRPERVLEGLAVVLETGPALLKAGAYSGRATWTRTRLSSPGTPRRSGKP
jgi:hypothetical protein